MSAQEISRRYVQRDSFVELTARQRAFALLDEGSGRELCDPFERVESPWLQPQGIVPQSDDGVVVAKGLLDGDPCVAIAIAGPFQGGSIGEVSGMKIAAALECAARDARGGAPICAVLLLESGGVRLQEANLGLNAVAEICAALLELRALRPVIGLVVGGIGCFGGTGIVAGLCSRLLVTHEARLGLNGPEVIAAEHGLDELDPKDRALVWALTGGAQRFATGLADALVLDDVGALRAAVRAAAAAGLPHVHRSQDLATLHARLDGIGSATAPGPVELAERWAGGWPGLDPLPLTRAPSPAELGRGRPVAAVQQRASAAGGDAPRAAGGDAPRAAGAEKSAPVASGRGRAWLEALADTQVRGGPDSLLLGDGALAGERARLIAVVADRANPFVRARGGEVGITESLALAGAVRAIVAEDARSGAQRPIVAIVDVPSQAYGATEELLGLHLTLAAAVDAYASARVAGHPVVALVVGTALSGGFLAHGLQASAILALDDPGVEIHAMHRPAAARITRRTVAELEQLGARIPPLSHSVRDWATLGFCDGLLPVQDAARPTAADVAGVRRALGDAIARARRAPALDRLGSTAARSSRMASIRVRETVRAQWDG